mgnify:CR=1 FL=1
MRRMILVGLMAAVFMVPAARANLPEFGGPAKVMTPMTPSFKFNFKLSTPTNQSRPVRVAPTCVTPQGFCWVPAFGHCYCCFWNGCWNGFSS